MAKENQSQIIFNQYLREKKMYGFFELKEAKNGIFYFSQIEDHQLDGLSACYKGGLVWKLSDEDRRKKPCDALSIPPLPAYIVIRFENSFYLMHIKWIIATKNAGAVSLTEKQVKNFAEKVIHI